MMSPAMKATRVSSRVTLTASPVSVLSLPI
ncbi:unknown [Enterocloster bolteae CAG:59]|nr:unknown [Enterocloster bolteae CAG:59]